MSGWRPALRIARRDALRHKGRSTLVAVLVAIPVLGASFADVIARTEQLDPQDVVAVKLLPTEQAQIRLAALGGAVEQNPVDPDQTGPTAQGDATSTLTAVQAAVQSRLPRDDRALMSRRWYDSPRVVVGDHTVRVSLGESGFVGGADWLPVADGSAPRAPDEVVVSADLADHEGLAVGSTLQVPPLLGTGPGRSYRVSGVVRAWPRANPLHLEGPATVLVIGLPGAILPQTLSSNTQSVGWSVVGPSPLTWADVVALNRTGFTALSRQVVLHPPGASEVPQTMISFGGSGTSSTVAGVLAVAVLLVLLQITLLAGPALAVGARRNTRTLALVAAAGGRRRHLRLVVLAGALVIGLVGSLSAAVVGAAVAAALLPWMRSSQVIGVMHGPRVDVHALDLLGLAAVGAVTALAAAWVPARQAARLDVVATLTGRRGQAAPRLHVPLVGLLLTAVGIGLGVVAARSYYPVWLAAAIAVAEIGLIVATGSVVSLAARLSRRTALPLRMALRDASRQRGRTVPAVAAVMAAVAGLVGVGIYLATQSAYDRNRHQPQLAADALVVRPMPGTAAGPGTATHRPTVADLTPVKETVRSTLPVLEDAVVYTATRTAPAAGGPGNGSQTAPSTAGLVLDVPAERECPTLPVSDPSNGAVQFTYEQRARADARCRAWGAQPSESIAYRPDAGVMVDDDGHTVALLTGTPDHRVAAALASGTVVVWDRNLIDASGSVHGHLVDQTTGESGPPFTLPATLARSRPGLGVPVLPTSVTRRLGLTVLPEAYLARLRRPASSGAPDTLATLSRRLDRVGDWTMTVEQQPDSSVAAALVALVAAAMLVALVGTLTSVGLAQVEGRADAATLSAVGAGPGVRRRLAAMQALTIAGLGTLLGLAGGLGAGWGMVQLRLAPVGTSMGAVIFDGGSTAGLSSEVWSLVVPWPQLVVGTVGLVVIAMAVAYATTRSTLPLERRLAS